MRLRIAVAGIVGVLVATALSVVGVAPAQAAVSLGVGGHVWANQPSTASYTISAYGPYAANDGGGDITITRSGVGSYQVRWAGLASVTPPGGGIAHASAYGSTTNLCAVASWVKSGADVVVQLRCFSAGGALADTVFTANFVSASGTDPEMNYTYLWANQPTAASYAPLGFYAFDGGGGAPWVYRDGVGNYRAYLPSAATYADLQTTFYQTTAYGTAAISCKVTGYLSGGTVRVQCRDAGGSMVDSRFTLTFAAQNLLLRYAPTGLAYVYVKFGTASIAWASHSDVSEDYSATRLGTGSYRVLIAGQGGGTGHAVARATGTVDSRCHVSGWYDSGSDVYVNVVCFTSSGAAVDSSFVVAQTW